MKKSNLVVGTKVQVKSAQRYFSSHNVGKVGEIIQVDKSDDILDVKVEFEDDNDWGNHKDLKLVRD